MIDTNKPVKIVVDDERRFDAAVKPSLLTALESYRQAKHAHGKQPAAAGEPLIGPASLRVRGRRR